MVPMLQTLWRSAHLAASDAAFFVPWVGMDLRLGTITLSLARAIAAGFVTAIDQAVSQIELGRNNAKNQNINISANIYLQILF